MTEIIAGPMIKETTETSDYAEELSELIREYTPNITEQQYEEDPYVSQRIIVEGNISDADLLSLGAEVILKGPDGTTILQFTSPEEAMEADWQAEEMPGVEFAEPDGLMKIEAATEAKSWGAARINAINYATELNTNAAIKVAVIDTGVSAHVDLKDRMVAGYDYIDGRTNAADKQGHGTHVAGIIADCTPGLNVQIMPVRVMDSNGIGWTSAISSGIKYAVDNGAKVLNLSLGGSHTRIEDKAIRYALNRGAIIVVAAGNEGTNTSRVCPAHIDGAIVVAAIDQSMQRADFSNYGSSVDICAPGVGIESCYYKGGYVTYDGTSMAAPHVTACAAMLRLKYPSYTPAQIEELIKKNAIDLGTPGRDDYYGWGLIRMPITAVTPTSLSLDKTSLTVYVGTSEKIRARLSGGGGGIRWSSSKPSVAKVSASGKVTGKKKGTAVISASAGGVTVRCTVKVKKATIKLSTKKIKIAQGKIKKIAAKVYGKSKKITWSSSNTSVATVSKKGKVKAKSKGRTTISASANGVTVKCKVVVQ